MIKVHMPESFAVLRAGNLDYTVRSQFWSSFIGDADHPCIHVSKFEVHFEG